MQDGQVALLVFLLSVVPDMSSEELQRKSTLRHRPRKGDFIRLLTSKLLTWSLSNLLRKAYLMPTQVGISSKSGIRGNARAERLWVEPVSYVVAPAFQIHLAGFSADAVKCSKEVEHLQEL